MAHRTFAGRATRSGIRLVRRGRQFTVYANGEAIFSATDRKTAVAVARGAREGAASAS
jgi:hypothetical protein